MTNFTNWRSIIDGSGVIPDSGVRQWPFVERTDLTITELLANDDGTIKGNPVNTSDGQFYEGYYEETDGDGDSIFLPVGEFENQIQSKEWGFAFTIRAGSNFLDGDANVFGGGQSSFDDYIFINDDGGIGTSDDGKPKFSLRQGDGSETGVESSVAIDDDTIYRVFWYVSTDDPSNWSIYINDSDSTGTTADANIDASQINLSGSVNNLALSGRNTGGTLEREVVADFDNPILYSDPSRQDITDDYQLQPWS